MRRVAPRVVRSLFALAVIFAFAAPVLAAEGGGEHAASGEHHEGINWYYGMLAESADVTEPNLLFRPKGMAAPVGAMLLNSGILIFGVIYLARKPLADALRKRRQSIMHGIEDAARMKDEAAARLAEFEKKLQHLDDDIERVKREMREAGETERARILADAKERRARMERDARALIEQELKAARELLLAETVRGAVKTAEELLTKQIVAADQQRLADEYLASLKTVQLGGPGGKA
ncbi:MAG: ATP synthase F0 subunit B [Sorangiineae bacterium]|nr:ATP synthase F0 subunit B [Polyangiaceae bacterium]MEB2322597.1 ATP synthase F0 subunit B [Sorangiineae bacterium]